ncbi:MAG: Chaperone SurA, partial [Pseudomonadota bacterium]
AAHLVPRRVAPYPPQRWRLADPGEVLNVSLWFSHILVRHSETEGNSVSFDVGQWTYVDDASRSRSEAFSIANAIARLAHRSPGDFPSLARAHSEDSASRATGGAEFGVRGFLLYDCPALLDALAVLRPGEVSRVVESRYGFHILRKEEPLPETTVSGTHLVVAYDQATWLHKFQAGRPIPRRSRSEALELVTQLYRRSVAEPDAFERLVQEYSDHRDAIVGGDFGNWSTRENSAFGPEINALLGVAVGEIAEPIDTFVGFQILKRSTVIPRRRWAMQAIVFPFDPEATSDHPLFEPKVRELAWSVFRTVKLSPRRFAEFQRRYCCEGIEQWSEGRGSQSLTAALHDMATGGIAHEPIKSDLRYVIPMRVEPPPEQSPDRVQTELPQPRHVDLGQFIHRASVADLVRVSRSIRVGVQALLHLEQGDEASLLDGHDVERLQTAASDLEKSAAWSSFVEDAKRRLSSDSFRTFEEATEREVERFLLSYDDWLALRTNE